MSPFILSVQEKIFSKSKELNKEETTIVSLIHVSWANGEKITQRDLAQNAKWIGVHPQWETKTSESGFIDTSSRRVRSIIRDLRVKHHMQILSDDKGYFFPFDRQDHIRVFRRMECEVLARNKSSLETYHELQRAFDENMQSEFFNDLARMTKGLEEKHLQQEML